MQRQMLWVAIAVAVFLAAVVAKPTGQSATTPLTNADVIRMVAGKLGDAVIITAIETSPRRNFDLSIDGLIALKQAGVSDAIIVVMQKLPAEKAPAPPAPPPPPPANTAAPAAPRVAAPAAPGTITPQEPPDTVVDAFRVNPTTGELMPLERTQTKEPRWSSIKTVHFEGAASPIAFRYGEPHVFAIRSFIPRDELRKEKRDYLRYHVEHLAVKDGKRYATKVYVPLDVEMYGQPVLRLAGGKGKNDLPAFAYLFVPRTRLPPGQYAFARGGLFDGFSMGAFAIVDR